MDKLLKLKVYVDGGINDTPFPNSDNPIEIGEFRYDAKRMGGAPTITASVNYPSCLDDEWTDNVYAEFNGEKYYLKQTPTSSYDNQDSMYKHDIELVSERVILDNVYFYNAGISSKTEQIVGNPQQSSEWQYFGNIDVSKDYTTFTARHANGTIIGVFDVVFDEAIRIVSGPPIDMKVESSTGNIYVYDSYSYLQELGLNLVFSYIDYEDDDPLNNSTKVVFFGNIREFASRLQASLNKCGVGYSVVVDDDVVTTEEKLMSFEDQFFSNVLQEIYNTYEVPYYFDGKTIHIGYTNESEGLPTFAYGVDNALLSITKNNANYKIVNRATATGSSDNIPFYYPNNSPKGIIAATPSGNFETKILDTELFSNEVKLDGVIRKTNIEYENAKVTFGGRDIYSGETFSAQMGAGGINKLFSVSFMAKDAGVFLLSFSSSVLKYILKEEEKGDATFGVRYYVKVYDRTSKKYTYDSKGVLSSIEDFEIQVPYANHEYVIYIDCYYTVEGKYSGKGGQVVFNASYSFGSKSGWLYEDKVIDLKELGLEVVGNTVAGDTITQTLVKYVNTSQKLMPFKYRQTDGAERFYNATNDTYEGITFKNPFVAGHPKEHIFTVEDIKPSIEGMIVNGQRIDMFEAFAYDIDDNDETYEDEDGNVYFKHPYFFAKLKPLGFNLFEHAIEQQPMVISFTSGDCGACNFEIAVDEDTQKNTVQVDENGNVKYDENGRVLCGAEGSGQGLMDFQDIQQDTTNRSVWIALRKEEDTYGILMPKAPTKDEQGNEIGGHRPLTEDTFVILGINLPYEYIEAAEKKLEAEIIKYLQENNNEKFTFSINFSRIYFEENPDILPLLSENSKIKITYNNKEYDLYVSSYSYSMGDNDVLPEIRVELDETLKVSQNALQNAISQVKSELGRAIGNIDILGATTPYFIRKDADDEARGKINFTKGIKFGEGGKVEVMDNNSAKLTIEYLEVTKKASFTSLEIQEKTHVGGQILVTPASINCGEVEELDDVYRCYFQTKGADGDEIFNQFAVGDQAVCQTYNAWGSVYYWRLVTGIGEDYIDLSKTDCDEESGIPKAGDKIIQLGNRTDVERQNAIVIAAYGDGSPYIIQYKGINSYEIGDDKIVTKLSSTENIFTGKVHMEMGSDGLDTMPEWIEVKETAQEALEKVEAMGENTFAELQEEIEKVKEESKEYTDNAKLEINTKISEVEQAKADIEDVYDKATADGKISDAEKKAISSANAYANAQSDYLDRTLRAWADGEIDDAEARAIAEAESKVNSAKEEMERYTDEMVNGMKIGGENLLRNSGFTGDYLSEQLADEKVLEGAAELYSSPFAHWDYTNANVQDSEASVSGKEVSLTSGSLTQSLFYRVLPNESYVVSFKAKGSSLRIEVGSFTKNIVLTNDWERYDEVFTTDAITDTFRIVNATCSLCDLQLEKGTKSTSWNNSQLDNSSDRAYYQSMKYLQDAMDGASEFFGGLALTETIQVGDYDKENKEWKKISGGINGVTTDASDDVAFWAGGTLGKAVETMMTYLEDPTYKPTQEELSAMAKVVITHGGRAILNEAIVRGTIFASDGEFTGKVNANSGNFGEGCTIGDDFKIEHIDGTTHIRAYEGSGVDSGYVGISKDGISVNQLIGKASSVSLNRNSLYTALFVNGRAGFSPTSDKDNIAIVLAAKDGYAVWAEEGMFAGLRPRSREVSGEVYLDNLDHTIFAPIPDTTLWLPSTPIEGQEYVILVSKGGVNVMGNGNSIFCFDGQDRTGFKCGDLAQRIEVRLYWNKVANQWWATFLKY